MLRRLSRVLALVAVVAQRDRGLDPVGKVVADLAEHRPGQVVLRVGEIADLRVELGQGLCLDLGDHAGAEIEHVAGRDEPVGRDGVGAKNPAEALVGGRRVADLLAQRLDVQPLVLRLVDSAEEERAVEQRRFRDRQKIELVAGQDLLELVVGRDRGERAAAEVEVELERGARHVALVDAAVVDPHRQAGVVDVLDDVEVERLRVDLRHVDPQVGGHRVVGLPEQLRAAGEVLEGIGFLAEERVVDVPVGIEIGARDLELPGVGIADRAADAAAHGVARARLVARHDAALDLVAWLAGLDDHRAADGVASVEGALGALQHLDALDVEQLLVELRGVGHQHAVDQHRHRGLAVARLGDASHDDEGRTLVLGLHHRHVWRQRDEILRPPDAGGGDLLVVEDIDRDRHVDQRLVALSRGDEDLLETLALNYHRLRLPFGCGECQRQQSRGR